MRSASEEHNHCWIAQYFSRVGVEREFNRTYVYQSEAKFSQE